MVVVRCKSLRTLLKSDLDLPPVVRRVLTGPELIMAVGLVVDYMVHVVHYFLHQVIVPSYYVSRSYGVALAAGPELLIALLKTTNASRTPHYLQVV